MMLLAKSNVSNPWREAIEVQIDFCNEGRYDGFQSLEGGY